MKFGTIGQIALPVSDANLSQKFYEEQLGLRFLYRFGELVFFDCDGLRLMLEGTGKTIQSQQCIYFKVTDIDLAYQTIRDRGTIFVDQPHLIAKMPDHELWMVFLQDPDGHMLALMSEKR